MKLVNAVVPDPNNPTRIGVVVEPRPGAPNRAFAQLAEGSDWHEMTQSGALAGGVYPARKGVGLKLECLALAWKLGRQAQQAAAPMSLPNPNSTPDPAQAGGLMLVLGAMLRAAAGVKPQSGPGAGMLIKSVTNLQTGATTPFDVPQSAPEADPFGEVAVDFETDSLPWDYVPPPPEPKQLPPPEPGVDGADVQKDCDEFDQSLADLTAHLDEARYRAGGL